ncbi:MAG TPA: TonB-dependent receptor [Steroidobacteraceae bacterium]|nr:TonB-dependent receptor [Steroidobacteraceae bacterium]
MLTIKRFLAGACVLAVAAPAVQAATPADASTSSTGGEALEEVIVTAQKRAESEQNVPMSITTFGSVQLQEKAINNFFDYATKVPNLAFAPTGDGVGTARTVSIRGISGDNVTGFYIDDTPLPDSIDPRVLDIDHIEVLRGPQGTLYGARSMGGTVRIITKVPDLTGFSATVHAAASDTDHTDEPNYTFDGIANIPILSDRVALRLTGFYDNQAGWFKRSFCTDPSTAGTSCFPLSTTGRTTLDNIAQNDTFGGSASLTIKLSDALTITPRVMMQRARYNGFPMADFNSMPNNGIGFPAPSGPYTLPQPLVSNDLTQARFFDVPEGGTDKWDLYSVAVHWKTDLGELVSSTAYFDRKVDETEDQSEFIWAAITSGACATPAPYCNPPAPGPIEEIKDYQRFVEEVRFASSLAGPVQFVAGAFYSDFHGAIPFASLYPPSQVPNLDNELTGGFPNNPDGIPNLVFAQNYHTDIEEPAVFGEVSWNLTSALKLTGGLRWYQVKTTSAGTEEGLATGSDTLVVGPRATDKENGTNPKVQLDYHLTPDEMVYALASKGFRPGGVVPIVPPGTPGTANDCVAALAAVNPKLNLADTRSFKSDSLWNYEVGTKTAWLDHRVIFNASAFDIRWKNIQQPILLGCGFQFTSNAGAAESKGGELELRGRATEQLEGSLGVGYQDAKITEKGNSPQPAGSPVFQVPNWTGNASVTYTVPLANGWNAASGLDYSYIGSSFSSSNGPVLPRERPAYRLLDARLAMTNGSTEVALVGKNLTNELTDLGDNRSIAAEVPGRPRLFVNQPRTIGIEVRQSF